MKFRGPTRSSSSSPASSGRGDGKAPSPGPRSGASRSDGPRSDGPRSDGGENRRPARGDAPARQASARQASARQEHPEGRGGKPAPRKPVAQPGWLYGLHAVAAAWTNPQRRCRALHVTEAGLKSLEPALQAAAAAGLVRPAPTLHDRDDLDAMLPGGAVHQGLVLDVAPLPELDVADICRAADPQDVVLMLDQVTDPHNVGAILRSAAAFGARAVIVQDRHAPEVTGVLAKTACGALEVVPIVRETNLARTLDVLRDEGFWCVGLAEEGPTPLHTLAEQGAMNGRTALVLGSEGDGLRRLVAQRCDALAHLPTQPPIGSLNVSNAAAVALYELARRR